MDNSNYKVASKALFNKLATPTAVINTIFNNHDDVLGSDLCGIIVCGTGTLPLHVPKNDLDYIVIVKKVTASSLKRAAIIRENLETYTTIACSNTVISLDDFEYLNDRILAVDGKAIQAIIEINSGLSGLIMRPGITDVICKPDTRAIQDFSSQNYYTIRSLIMKHVSRMTAAEDESNIKLKLIKLCMIAQKMKIQFEDPSYYFDRTLYKQLSNSERLFKLLAEFKMNLVQYSLFEVLRILPEVLDDTLFHNNA